MKNPFKNNTISHHDWEVLKDFNWHCTKCELKSGQAKIWQVWRQERGIQIDKDENDNWFKRIDCPKCDNKTIHRKLKSLELLDETKSRSGINPKLARRVKQVYDNTDALLLRKISPNLLEVDYKFPQIRWQDDEAENKVSMNDDEIKEKFILLTRENNLLKSRKCENCVKTGIRSNFTGIYFWYQGDENWQGDKYNEDGCVGCFWHDPYKWREELNKIVNK